MKVFGQIVDSANEPMSLANVTIVTGALANKMGAQADLDGNFSLEHASITPESFFRVSFVGYVPRIFKATDLQGQKITLSEDSEMLETVTITGNGKPKDIVAGIVKSSGTAKQKLLQHVKDHKFVYAGIGGLAGIALIALSLTKIK